LRVSFDADKSIVNIAFCRWLNVESRGGNSVTMDVDGLFVFFPLVVRERNSDGEVCHLGHHVMLPEAVNL
jgi:hypothetical protein